MRPRTLSPRSSKVFAALAIFALLVPAVVGAQPDPGEYGDAPSFGMAYPGLGVMGAFPTCIGGPYVSHGPHPPLAFFGASVDFESDGNAGICAFPPYELDECSGPADMDAGIQNVSTYTIDPVSGNVDMCGSHGLDHIGDSCDIVQWGGAGIDIFLSNTSGQDCLVNVLFDWNRDGMWGGGVACPGGAIAEEHVVQNFLVPNGYTGTLAGLGAPPFQVGPDRGYFWARFTIASHWEPVPADWSGAQEFEFGETEDYLLSVGENLIAGDLGDAPEDVVAYPPLGIIGRFPTCMGGTNGHVLHTGNAGAWLGAGVDMEAQGNADLCGFTQYDNDECDQWGGDAGIRIAEPFTIDGGVIQMCFPGQGRPLGNPCDFLDWGTDIDMWIENHTNQTRYMNVVFDWNMNGRWGDWTLCTISNPDNEHVVIDLPVPGGYVGPMSALGAGGFQAQVQDEGYVWTRFTLSDMPVGVDGWDGQGTFGDGETEDYLFKISYATPAPEDMPIEAGVRLEHSFPNPFNPKTEIAFALSEPADVRLTIHDATGRRIAELANRRFDAGRHGVTWFGRDDQGREQPSGNYFVRLRAGGEERRGKLTLIK